jgi:hypothetical protein
MPHVDLAAELNALAEASADALSRLRDGDEHGTVEVVERRERLLHELGEHTVDVGPALVEAARAAMALDPELMAMLRSHQADIGRRIQRLAHARRSLSSYGATGPRSALYVERLG